MGWGCVMPASLTTRQDRVASGGFFKHACGVRDVGEITALGEHRYSGYR